MAARASYVNVGGIIDPGRNLQSTFKDVSDIAQQLQGNKTDRDDRVLKAMDSQISATEDRTVRDSLLNTDKNEIDSGRVNDEYNTLNSKYEERKSSIESDYKAVADEEAEKRAVIEKASIDAGFGSKIYGTTGKLQQSQKSIDAGNNRTKLIGELDAEYQPVLEDLNARTQNAYEQLRKGPVQDARGYSQRIERNLLEQGVPAERASAVAKDAFEKNKQADLTDREKLQIELGMKRNQSVFDANNDAANTKLGKNSQTQGTNLDKFGNPLKGSTKYRGSGSEGGKLDANIKKIGFLGDEAGFLSTFISSGDGARKVESMGRNIINDINTGDSGIQVTQADSSNALWSMAEGEAGAWLKGDPSINKPAWAAATIKMAEARIKNKKSGNGKTHSSQTESRDVFAPNRGEVLKANRDVYNANNKRLQDRLDVKGDFGSEFYDEAFGGRSVLKDRKKPTPKKKEPTGSPEGNKKPKKKNNERIFESAIDDGVIDFDDGTATDEGIGETPQGRNTVDPKLDSLSPEARKIVDSKEKKKAVERKSIDQLKKATDSVDSSQKSLDSFKKTYDSDTASVAQAKEFKKLRSNLRESKLQAVDARRQRQKDKVGEFFNKAKGIFKTDVEKAAEREADNFKPTTQGRKNQDKFVRTLDSVPSNKKQSIREAGKDARLLKLQTGTMESKAKKLADKYPDLTLEEAKTILNRSRIRK